jgi:hypothetical protein
MVHLFIHLLLKANTTDCNWRGVDINRGQLVAGRKSLSDATGISEKSIRTCLGRLKATGEIRLESASKYSIITVCNYEDYQPEKKPTGQQRASKGPAKGHNIRIKEEERKNIYARWLEESENHMYQKFVAWILDENLPNCMKLKDHLDEEKFLKVHKNAKRNNELIKRTISNMENKPDLTKKYTSFYRTLDNWIKMEIGRRN